VSQSLELSHLNDKATQFAPKSHADEGGLQAGRLQLVDGTLLLVDENTMQEGQLKDNGIENIKTLSSLLTSKKLPYKFPYNDLEMDTDVNCVILSHGKSFLPFDVQIPLQPLSQEPGGSSSSSNNSRHTFASQDFRRYLSAVQSQTSQTKSFTITSDISSQIQNSVGIESQEVLSRIIHLARLLCISKGGSQLGWDDWERAKSLDSQRLSRLK
jgi:hypothetical protein